MVVEQGRVQLRPNGGDGPLVLTESSFKEYFARAAEAWEGIAYMKSRVVAGDPKRAERFLHELQEIDWQRYGQSGRSRSDLRQIADPQSRPRRHQATIGGQRARQDLQQRGFSRAIRPNQANPIAIRQGEAD